MASLLTPEDHVQFVEEGFALVRGLLPPDVVARALATLDAPTEGGGHDENGQWRVADVSAVLADCVTRDVLDCVADLFGPGVEFARNQVLDRPRPPEPQAAPGLEPHCDLVYPAILPDTWALGIFVFLTPAVPGSGCFYYAPGSTRRLRVHTSLNCSETCGGAGRSDAVIGELRECLAEPGDAVFFTQLMVHSASTNRTLPRTRHALDIRFRQVQPLVPGAKPFEQMSTLEKANSARYLHERFGDPLLFAGLAGDAVAPIGAAGLGNTGDVVTADTIRIDGRVHLLTVEADAPHMVRHRHSGDLAAWTEEAPISLTDGQAVTSLHLEHRHQPTLTLVTRTPGGARRSLVLSSAVEGRHSLEDLVVRCEYPGALVGRPHHVHAHLSAHEANGRTQVLVRDEDPTLVRWRSREADPASEKDLWDREGELLRAPRPIADVSMWSVADGWAFALVADIENADGIAATAVARTSMTDLVEEPLVPLLAAGTPVHGVRVFQRGPGAWLVTYIPRDNRPPRVRLGLVDWGHADVGIRELLTAADLDEALCRVGLR